MTLLYLMARSSRGEDARFSFWKQGFDSPTGYEKASILQIGAFFMGFNLGMGLVPRLRKSINFERFFKLIF